MGYIAYCTRYKTITNNFSKQRCINFNGNQKKGEKRSRNYKKTQATKINNKIAVQFIVH